MSKIKSFKKVCEKCHKEQKKGKKVVYCNGTFDIFHKGHVVLLSEAKKFGDLLVVGVDHDSNIKLFKGPNRPINNQKARAFVVSSLEVVDYVFPNKSIGKLENADAYYLKVCEELKPNFIMSCKKSSKNAKFQEKNANVIGAKYVDTDYVYENYTTKTLELLGLE